ncbi:hypothetical protein MTO96_042563, partial [Rhipicephalus appendiculatus]
KRFYELLKQYHVLSTKQLKALNFPTPHPTEPGRAVFFGSDRHVYSNPDESTHRCSRCRATFSLTKDGDYVRPEKCVHHWGRFGRYLGGYSGDCYSCCYRKEGQEGCSVGQGHVHEGPEPNRMTGFVSTAARSPTQSDRDCPGVFACYTSKGMELIRVTVVGWDKQLVYDALVKPYGKILDYYTRFTGIQEKDMVAVQKNLADVQAELLQIFDKDSILLGHSLDSDLRALRLIHPTVVDTSIAFPHKRGLPFRRALRNLAKDHLGRTIQKGEDGHDSRQDAVACMELMLLKVRRVAG